MIIDLVPVWVLFFIAAAFVLFSIEVGFRLGRAVRGTTEEERESPASSIASVILGLQAFMLAFTFSIVSDRYDSKKGLVREEANAIRSAFHRSDFLPEPDRAKTKLLLHDYLDQRVALAQARNAKLVEDFLGTANQMQQELWDMAVVNGRRDNSDISASYLQSIDDIMNLHATRVAVGLQARIPTGIWVVLLCLLILGMAGVGYHTAIADSRRSRVAPILAVAFALVIALIAALDHPGNGLLPVTQQPLVTVLNEINSSLGIDASNQ